MTLPARPRTRTRTPPPRDPAPRTSATAPLARLLNPLRHAAAAFFKHDVALRRVDDGLHIVFEQRATPGKSRPDTPAEAAARKEDQEFAVMRSQLGALLDELPETRQALRHLVFVEKALALKGLKALDKLPLDLLQRALEQFEGLVTNWSPVGLAALRSKIAVAIIDREQRDPDAEAGVAATSALCGATTLPDCHMLPLPLVEAADDEALAAAYAALGGAAPAAASPVDTGGLTLRELHDERA